MMKLKLSIDKVDGIFCVDQPSVSGSPYVGYGRTMMEAIGNYFHNNQSNLDIEFDVKPAVIPTEMRRRKRELAKR